MIMSHILISLVSDQRMQDILPLFQRGAPYDIVLLVVSATDGVFIGWLETVAGAYLGGEYRMPATFLVLAVILVIRPYGLFGTHEIERV